MHFKPMAQFFRSKSHFWNSPLFSGPHPGSRVQRFVQIHPSIQEHTSQSLQGAFTTRPVHCFPEGGLQGGKGQNRFLGYLSGVGSPSSTSTKIYFPLISEIDQHPKKIPRRISFFSEALKMCCIGSGAQHQHDRSGVQYQNSFCIS